MSSQDKKTKTILDAYDYYVKTAEWDVVDRKTFATLCMLFNRAIMHKVMEGKRVPLPAKMGAIEIKGFKEKVHFNQEGRVEGLSPNWKETKKLWAEHPEAKAVKKIVYNTNEHSSGIRYKFLWCKKHCHVTNKTVYSLRVTRSLKRELSARIFQGVEYNSK